MHPRTSRTAVRSCTSLGVVFSWIAACPVHSTDNLLSAVLPHF